VDVALWARCKAGDSDSRCALIESYTQLATRIARNMWAPAGAHMFRAIRVASWV